jgi:hypothetical protein
MMQSLAAQEQAQVKSMTKGLDKLEAIDVPDWAKKLIVSCIDAVQEFATPHLEKANKALAVMFNMVCEAIESALK